MDDTAVIGLTLERIACSPVEIVVDVASLVRVRALEKRLTFSVDFATPIPEVIQSDPTRLRQILMNLAGNAIKFTQSGSVTIVVRCEAPESPSPKVSFSLTDHGIGMSKAQLDGLFQPFTQADSSTTRRFGGTGLGLVICKRLADMLGGTLTVQSELGRGSTFTLTVEAGSLDGVRMLAGLQEGGPSVTAPDAAPTTATDCEGDILLAEDGVDNQLLISTHLKKAGATVTIAENGRIAVEKAVAALESGKPFDVILMDMQMPELDGYGAAARLRSRGYTGAIVALTAHAMATDRERCLRAGCDDYLTKPVNRPLLLSTVRRYVDEARVKAAAKPARRVSTRPPLFSEYAREEDMQPLVEKFVGSLAQRVAALRGAADLRDLGAMRTLAHQLRGAGAGYGFTEITSTAALLEDSVKMGAPAPEVTERLRELISICERARVGTRSTHPGKTPTISPGPGP